MAPLTPGDVVAHLVDRGLLDTRTVVRGGVRVEQRSRRNLNFLVHVGESGYFVKQGIGPQRRTTLAAEVAVCRAVEDGGSLDEYLVPVRDFDPVRSIAVFDLVPAAMSGRDHFVRSRRFLRTVAKRLGLALAGLHGGCGRRFARVLPGRGPAEILALHRPTSAILGSTSRAGLKLVAIAQRATDLGDALDAAASSWRFDALIHGDVRWDNCLLDRRPGSTRATRLKLIDWELGRLGDPAWDIGSVFAEYIGAWVGSLPPAAQRAPDRMLDSAEFPLERIHAPVNAFWDAYRRGRTDTRDDMAELRVRSTGLAGARLVQSAFERADRRAQVPALSVILVQVGFNCLTRPHDAAAHLFGLNDGATP